MAGDGVSMPQTIAQMGQVAKTQAKGQHQAQAVTPFSEQLDKHEELRIKRVKETEATDKQRIEREDDAADKRQRRRQRRRRKLVAQGDGKQGQDEEQARDEDNNDAERVGVLIDLRA